MNDFLKSFLARRRMSDLLSEPPSATVRMDDICKTKHSRESFLFLSVSLQLRLPTLCWPS